MPRIARLLRRWTQPAQLTTPHLLVDCGIGRTAGARHSHHACGRAHHGHMASMLVGRGDEVAALRGLITDLPDSSAAVLVRGEAGIGKTHLVRSVLDEHSGSGVRILRGACAPMSSATAYSGLDAALGGALESGASADRFPSAAAGRAWAIELLRAALDDEHSPNSAQSCWSRTGTGPTVRRWTSFRRRHATCPTAGCSSSSPGGTTTAVRSTRSGWPSNCVTPRSSTWHCRGSPWSRPPSSSSGRGPT